MKALSLENLSKSFGALPAVHGISLSIQSHAFATLLGPSGCGKSTVLRLIAGLERPNSGSIAINGLDVTNLPPHHRPCTLVFQRYALFPHLTVQENVAFGLRRNAIREPQRSQRVMEALELVALGDRATSKPHQLSGGQEQRVALARALVVQPDVLLLDEPLSALDAAHRKHMQQELRAIQRHTGITFLSVTHDQEEALSMSDWVGVMQRGQLEQWGTPTDVFNHPANQFVAEFMGASNLIPIARAREMFGIQLPEQIHQSQSGLLMIRPEAVSFSSEGIPAVVESTTYMGTRTSVTCRLADGSTVIASVAGSTAIPEVGTTVRIAVDVSQLAVVPDAG